MNTERYRFFSPAVLMAAACVSTMFPQSFDRSGRLWLLIPVAIIVALISYGIPPIVRRFGRSREVEDLPYVRGLFLGSIGLTLCAIVGLEVTRIVLIGIAVLVAQLVLAIIMVRSRERESKHARR